MIRSLHNIPDLSLPPHLVIRPVQPEHYECIWKAAINAFQGTWESAQVNYELLKKWVKDPTCNPALWYVAWDNNRVAGMALNFIDEKENKEYNRKWGTIRLIAVCRPYRRKGLAKALIARSFKGLKEYGMTDAVLQVDAHNVKGALHLYEYMGFNTVKQVITYRKPMDEMV
jgi:ribosomal protein S18 acetylase RimI-like enzyme